MRREKQTRGAGLWMLYVRACVSVFSGVLCVEGFVGERSPSLSVGLVENIVRTCGAAAARRALCESARRRSMVIPPRKLGSVWTFGHPRCFWFRCGWLEDRANGDAE